MPRDSEFFSAVVEAPVRFSAYACGEGPGHSHAALQARSFEEAALEFTETWHGDEPQVQVIVVDRETGREQCFTIDVGGDVEVCG
jgi:hypothetical protein